MGNRARDSAQESGYRWCPADRMKALICPLFVWLRFLRPRYSKKSLGIAILATVAYERGVLALSGYVNATIGLGSGQHSAILFSSCFIGVAREGDFVWPAIRGLVRRPIA